MWPHADYPLVEVGRMTLDRNPTDHHAQIEQLAVEPSNLVPGIGPSPDKMLLGRMFSYPDAHRYRIGVNYNQLPVNAPRSPVHSYSKDGAMRYQRRLRPGLRAELQGRPAGRHRRATASRPAGTPTATWSAPPTPCTPRTTTGANPAPWSARSWTTRQRDRLVDNIVGHLLDGVTEPVLERAFEYWRNVDKDLGQRVEDGVRAAQS